jgi:predicted TIM-barrel fold metal-dependent hydrolase
MEGIVAAIDPRIGKRVVAVIDRHLEAAEGLLRGFRARVGYDPARQYVPEGHMQWSDQMSAPEFREGAALVGQKGLVLDLIFYHTQLQQAFELAKAVPETTFVINHLAFPIGVGSYALRRDVVEQDWRRGIAALAELPNVMMKIGGFGMRIFGHGWTELGRPVSSDEIAGAMSTKIAYAIECFGPGRCMLESNFPVDGLSFGYVTVWNAFKKMTAQYTTDERAALFHDTAVRVYGLDDQG